MSNNVLEQTLTKFASVSKDVMVCVLSLGGLPGKV